MAFNINAHVILSGPKNIKAVTKNIQKQLTGVTATVDIKTPKNIGRSLGTLSKRLQTLHKDLRNVQSSASGATSALRDLGTQVQSLNSSTAGLAKSQSRVQASLQKTGKNVQQVGNEIQEFGKDAALAIRRFAAFTVATGVVFGFVRAIQTATKAAIDYEREITKIIQVTGAGAAQIGKLKSTIDDLSTSLGVDANELANLARTFAQTGQSIAQVRSSITAVARSSLAPSFGEMKNTAEGLIAALAQFNIAAKDSEQVLASINAVSKKFAVEAEDLVSVIRRAGGVFSQAAGQFDDPKRSLNELIGIFTAVRSTTRESADTIAVGLRTIFTRIQRRGTIDFLKQFNIELVDARGNFIGLFPAFERLSAGLSDIIRKGDALTLSAITEELGGVRQVGKLIPAITQFNKALAATKIAGEAAKDGLGKDVALALQPLGKRFEKLQQRFTSLIRSISESKTFQNLANVALSLGNAFLTVAENLKPLLPLITTFAAIKISKGIFDFGQGFVGGLRRGGGAAGLGDRLGGGGGGGGGGGTDGGGTPDRSGTASRQALTNAIRSNSVLLGTNNTALQNLTSRISSNNATLTTTSSRLTSSVTQLIGAIGNLINALNRFGGGFGGLGGGGRRPRRRFARGGLVPGTGNTDTVPAMLQPGEFVLRKSSVGKLGAGTLDAMNSNKFASGGKASDFMASRHLVGERDFTFSKPKGTEFKKTGGKDKNRFNAKDEFAYTRQRDTSINVNSLYRTEQERKDPNYRAYKDASSAQKRGLAFEKILKAKGLVSELAKSPTSRLDAVTPEGTAAEIKSELEALSEARLSEKMIGAALKGKDSIEQKVQANLTNTALTAARNTIGLGAVEVFQDTTGGLGATRAKKPRRRRFAAGGVVTSGRGFYGIKPAGTGRLTSKQLEAASDDDLEQLLQHPSVVNSMAAQGAIQKEKKKRDKQKKGIRLKTGKVGGLFLEKGKKATSTSLKSNFPQGTLGPPFSNVQQLTGSIGAYTLRSKASSAVKDQALPMLENAIEAASEAVVKSFEIPRLANVNEKDLAAQAAGRVDLNAITGHLFEGFTSAVSQAPLTESKSLFDFMSPSAESLLAMGKIFQPSSITERLLEAKKLLSYDSIGSRSKDNSIINKVMGGANAGLLKKGDFDTYKFAAGGSVFKPKGTDTVPAMLTPGEFVINKKSAEKIGYGNLGRMNRYYAKGGVAAKGNMTQYFADGTTTTPGGIDLDAEVAARQRLIDGIGAAVGVVSGFTAAFASFDADNPLPSIIALGFAADAATKAIASFAGAQALGGLKDALRNFKIPGTKGKLGEIFDKEVGKFTKAPEKLRKAFSNATRRFRNLRTGAGGLPPKGVVKSAAGALGKFTKSLGGIGKIIKGFGGLPLLLASLIAKPLVDAISGAVVNFFAGEKETIEGTDIEGRRGLSGGQGALVGLADSAGAATAALLGAAGIATMLGGVWAPIIIALGAGVAAFKLFQGAVMGASKQLEFNAFVKLQDSAKSLSKTLDDFGKLDVRGPAALKRVNKELVQTLDASAKAVDASINRQLVEGIFSFTGMLYHTEGAMRGLGRQSEMAALALEQFGMEAEAQRFSGGAGARQGLIEAEFLRQGSGGIFGQAISAGFTQPLAQFGGLLDKLNQTGGMGDFLLRESLGAVPLVGPMLEKFAPLLGSIGAAAAQQQAQAAMSGRSQIFMKATQAAAAQIDPKTIEGLDKAVDTTMGDFAAELGALGDIDALKQLATLQIVTDDLSDSTKVASDSYGELTSILTGGIGPMEKFGAELSKLMVNVAKTKVFKQVADQIKVMNDSGRKASAGGLGETWFRLQDSDAFKTGNFKGMVDELERIEKLTFKQLNTESDGELGEIFTTTAAREEYIKSLKEGAIQIKGLLTAQQQDLLAKGRQKALLELSALAAERSARALDALVSGMQQFSTKATGVADQFGMLTSSLQNEFSQITGEKLVGKLETFNPFENVAAATDAQIDTAVNQLKGLGTEDDSELAFREMASLAKGQRDLPLVVRDVLNQLTIRSQRGDEITDADVESAVIDGLKAAGIELPEVVKESLKEALRGQAGTAGTRMSRQNSDLVFTLDKVKDLLSKEGAVLGILGPASEETVKGLAASFNALNKFKNSLLEVARIQQQIAKHRLKGELEMLSHQVSVRDRINKALGEAPDALKQATTDLRNRLETLVGAGLQGQGALPDGSFQGNVLDPSAMLERLKTIEGEREKRRQALGLAPGQAVASQLQGEGMTDEMRRNSDELFKLNAESNALKQALKELAKDTRMLAALEQKIIDQNTRETTAKGGLATLADAIDRFSRGEMSPEEFNDQITTPLDIVERIFAKEKVSFQELVKIFKMFQAGDPLAMAAIDVKAQEMAGPNADPADVAKIRQKLEQEFFVKLTAMMQAMTQAGGLPGLSQIIGKIFANMAAAQGKKKSLAQQMQEVGNAQNEILKGILEVEHKQLKTVLDTAEMGFKTAVDAFRDAVEEFAIMRGGINEGKVESRRQRAEDAEKNRKVAEDRLEEAEAKKPAKDASEADKAKHQDRIKELQRQLQVAQEAERRAKKNHEIAQRLFGQKEREKEAEEGRQREAENNAPEHPPEPKGDRSAETPASGSEDDRDRDKKPSAGGSGRGGTPSDGGTSPRDDRQRASQDREATGGGRGRGRSRTPSAAGIAGDSAMLIVTAIGACCQVTSSRLEEIIRVLGGDLSLVSGQTMGPEEFNKTIQRMTSIPAGDSAPNVKQEQEANSTLSAVSDTALSTLHAVHDPFSKLAVTLGDLTSNMVGETELPGLAEVIRKIFENALATGGGGVGCGLGFGNMFSESSAAGGGRVGDPLGLGVTGASAGLGSAFAEQILNYIRSSMQDRSTPDEGAASGRAMAHGMATATTEGPEIKKEFEQAKAKSAKTGGGILGALNTLNNTAKDILKCLCGDIFSELADNTQATQQAKEQTFEERVDATARAALEEGVEPPPIVMKEEETFQKRVTRTENIALGYDTGESTDKSEEAPAAAEATRVKTEEAAKPKGPGGILGELKTLNLTAKNILKCLCGDIFPEMASTAANTAASTAAVSDSATAASTAASSAQATAEQGTQAQQETAQSADDAAKASQDTAKSADALEGKTSDESKKKDTEHQAKMEEQRAKAETDAKKALGGRNPLEQQAERQEERKEASTSLNAGNASMRSAWDKYRNLREAGIAGPEKGIADSVRSMGMIPPTLSGKRRPTRQPQTNKTKTDKADEKRFIPPTEEVSLRDKAKGQQTGDRPTGIPTPDGQGEWWVRSRGSDTEKPDAGTEEKPTEQKPTPKPEPPTPVRGGILGVLISIDKNIKSLLDCCKLGGGGVGGGGGAAAPMALMDAAREKADIIKQKADRDVAEVDKNLKTKLEGIAEERKGIEKGAQDKFNKGLLFEDKLKEYNTLAEDAATEADDARQRRYEVSTDTELSPEAKAKAMKKADVEVKAAEEKAAAAEARYQKELKERKNKGASGSEIPRPTIDPTGDTPQVAVRKRGLMRGAMRRGGAAPNLGIQRRVFENAQKKLKKGDASMMESLIEADEQAREMGGQGVNQYAREFKQDKIKAEMKAEEDRLKAEEAAARKKAETDKKDITDTADKERTKVLDDASKRAQGAKGERPPGPGPAPAAGGNAGKMIAKAMLESATKFATTFSDQNMNRAGETFGLAVQKQLKATDITVRAQMGPVTVTLSDNGLLDQLKAGLKGWFIEHLNNTLKAGKMAVTGAGTPEETNSHATVSGGQLQSRGMPPMRGGGSNS